jgi:hypothetical protein
MDNVSFRAAAEVAFPAPIGTLSASPRSGQHFVNWSFSLKNSSLRLAISLLVASIAVSPNSRTAGAQSFSSSTDMPVQPLVSPEPGGLGLTRPVIAPAVKNVYAPFSRVSFGVNVSPLGVGLMAATNLNSHLDIRGDGSFFNYTDNSWSTQGFNVDANISLASARVSADYYPFHKGFRLTPGVMFLNRNGGNFNLAVAPGQSFTLNGQTYFSASGANAVKGAGTFGLGNGSPAFTLTTGWGHIVPHYGRHISFPFELGVAFIKDPTLNFNLTGYGCDATGANCMNVATSPQIQANLAAQVKTYQSDIDGLKTYPIASFGVAYSFGARRTIRTLE